MGDLPIETINYAKTENVENYDDNQLFLISL